MKLKLIDNLKSSWDNCIKCSLSSLRTQVVFGYGNLDATLVMIGEAPGKDEDIKRIPFVGRAGEKFNELLDTVNILRSDIYITNICLCRPKSNKVGKENRQPRSSEISTCFPRLLEELSIIKPDILVLAGNIPLYAFTNKKGITKNRGWQDINLETLGIKHTFATLHPASLLYGSNEQKKQKQQFLYEDWLQITEVLSAQKVKTEKNNQKEGGS